jgi:hypothetical protein
MRSKDAKERILAAGPWGTAERREADRGDETRAGERFTG